MQVPSDTIGLTPDGPQGPISHISPFPTLSLSCHLVHFVCWIRDIVKFQLVLSLGFPKIFTSVVPYLSLSFSAILSSLSLIIGVKWALLKQGGNYHAWFITSTFTITLKSVAAEFINKCTSKFESEWVTLHIAYTVNWNCCPLLPNAGLVSHMHLSLNFWQRLVSVP